MTIDSNESFINDLNNCVEKEKITEALRKLESQKTLSESSSLRKMKGTTNRYRLRVGNYRVVLQWNKATQTLIAEVIADRKDIYKKR
jgi:mRNA interferase RelE/StbE